MKTFIRFSVMREKKAITEHKNDFSCIVIDAHVLESFQNAASGYIMAQDFDYIVDPNTYRFALEEIRSHSDKKWYSNLVDIFEIADLLRFDGNIHLDDFTNHNRLRKFVNRVIKYQEKRVINLSGETQTYLSLLENDIIRFPKDKPYCIIPPYFIINDMNILDVNINSIKIAKEISREKIYACVPIPNELIYDDQIIAKIVRRYAESNADGIFIWIIDFNEIKERTPVLTFQKKLFETFKSAFGEKEVFNMFGGFFSTILTSMGIIDGVVHGVGISESRNPYTESGPAPTRYYVPSIHRMLSQESSQDIVDTIGIKCECNICSSSSISNLKTKQLLRHALNSKILERDEIIGLSIEEIIEKLDEILKMYRNIKDPNFINKFKAYSEHIAAWIMALTS